MSDKVLEWLEGREGKGREEKIVSLTLSVNKS